MGWLNPEGWRRHGDLALLLTRLSLGAYLVWGVWDNIVSAGRMAEFAAFLTRLDCPFPELAAPLSVWVQFLIGLSLILGLGTRWAGLLLGVNFLVAVLLLGRAGAGLRDLYDPAILVFVGLLLAALGAGRWALDARLTGPPADPT